MSALEILGSAATGGLVGLVGSVVKDGLGIWGKKEEYAHTLRMRRMDIEAAKVGLQQSKNESDSRERVTEIEASSVTLKAALDSDKATYNIVWVDAIRGLIRPAITVYALMFLTYLIAEYYNGGAVVSESLYKELVLTLTFICTSSIGYWFGSRSSSAKLTK